MMKMAMTVMKVSMSLTSTVPMVLRQLRRERLVSRVHDRRGSVVRQVVGVAVAVVPEQVRVRAVHHRVAALRAANLQKCQPKGRVQTRSFVDLQICMTRRQGMDKQLPSYPSHQGLADSVLPTTLPLFSRRVGIVAGSVLIMRRRSFRPVPM